MITVVKMTVRTGGLAWLLLFLLCGRAGAVNISDLLFHLSFDKRSTVANYALGNPNGTIEGSKTAFVPGLGNDYAAVVGREACLRYETAGNISGAEGTITLWVQLTDWRPTDIGFFCLFSADKPSGAGLFRIYKWKDNSRLLFLDGDTDPKAYPGYNMAPVVSADIGSWKTGEWHFVAVTWEAASFSLAIYVDGKKAGYVRGEERVREYADRRIGFSSELGGSFRIGGRQWSPSLGSLVIDEVKIYRRALKEREVQQEWLDYQRSQGLQSASGGVDGAKAPGVTGGIEILSKKNLARFCADISGLTGYRYEDVCVQLMIDGKNAGTFPAFTSYKGIIDLKISDTGGPGTHKVEWVMRARNTDRVIGRYQDKLRLFAPVEPNRLGMDDVVPAPWTEVTVSADNTVSVWGRSYDLGNHPLPRQIWSKGEAMLSSEAEYIAEFTDGQTERIGRGELHLAESKSTGAKFEFRKTTGSAALHEDILIEFDGMVRFDVNVQATKPIRRFYIEVSFTTSSSQYFHPCSWRVNGTELAIPQKVWAGYEFGSGEFYPVLNVLSFDRGLSWFCNSPRSWIVDIGKAYFRFTQDREASHLRVFFINTDSQDTKSVEASFGIQAFPTRPPIDRWRSYGAAPWYVVFEPPFGTLGIDILERWLAKPPVKQGDLDFRVAMLPFGNFPRGLEETGIARVQAAIASRNKQLAERHGLTWFGVYLTPTYGSSIIPEWKYFRSEWQSQPEEGFDEYLQPRASTANPSWRDFWIKVLDAYLTNQPQINMLFHDMAGPYPDRNAENSLGYVRGGVFKEEFPIWETRDLFKRIYILTRKKNKQFWSFANYWNWTPPIHSFCDFLLTGEIYMDKIARSYNEVSLGAGSTLEDIRLLTAFDYGPKIMWLPALTNPRVRTGEPKASIAHYGMMLLNDVVVEWDAWINPEVRKNYVALKKRMGIDFDEAVTFIPYWKAQDLYACDSNQIKVSFYKKRGLAMAVVVNTAGNKDFSGTVKFDVPNLLASDPQVSEVSLYDPIASITARQRIVNGILPLKLGSEMYKVVFLGR